MSDENAIRAPDGYTVRLGIPGAEPAGWLVIRDNGQMLMNAGRIFDLSDDAARFLIDHLAGQSS